MKRVLLILCIFIPGLLQAQFDVSFDVGVGWFSMDGLHKLQKQALESYPVEAKMTSEFPPYFIYEGSVNWKYHGLGFIGASVGYGSTGARIFYSDYSGEAYSDFLLHYYSYSLSLGFEHYLKNDFLIRFNLRPGATFTDFTTTDVLKAGGYENSESLALKSLNVTLQPTVSLGKEWRKFEVHTFAGYHITAMGGKLHPKGDKDSFLVDSNNDKIIADWRGLRLGLGFTYYIGQRIYEEAE